MRAESTRLICPAPTPSGHAVPAEHDGVGLDELGHAPGEQQILQLRVGRAWLRSRPSGPTPARCSASGVCTNRPPPTAFAGRSRCASAPAALRSTRTLVLAASSAARLTPRFGRDHDLDELLHHRRGRRRVELAVEGDDAAEGRGRIGGKARLYALSRSLATAAPQGLACLMITQAG